MLIGVKFLESTFLKQEKIGFRVDDTLKVNIYWWY